MRQPHAEEISRVVLVVDRRPSMALYPADLPWLHKPAAIEHVTDVLVASAGVMACPWDETPLLVLL